LGTLGDIQRKGREPSTAFGWVLGLLDKEWGRKEKGQAESHENHLRVKRGRDVSSHADYYVGNAEKKRKGGKGVAGLEKIRTP